MWKAIFNYLWFIVYSSSMHYYVYESNMTFVFSYLVDFSLGYFTCLLFNYTRINKD